MHSRAPPNSEFDSIIQPGVAVLELPPELPGVLTKIGVNPEKGESADTYFGMWWNSDGLMLRVAIKCIRLGGGSDRLGMRIKREAVIWTAARHPNILEFFGYRVVEGVPWLVSPWCQHRSLSRFIANNPGITYGNKIKLLCDAACGLAHLHTLTPLIVHGNIQPENVIVQDNLEAALCDFGLSKLILDLGTPSGLTTTGSGVGGTAGYQAKELLEGNPPAPAGDVYAFGGLILYTMSGRHPLYNRKNDAARIVAICMEQIPVPQDHPDLPETDPLWRLLGECWSPNPIDRPTIYTILHELEHESEPLSPRTPEIQSIGQGDFQTIRWELPPPVPGKLVKDGKRLEGGGFGDVHRGKFTRPNGDVMPVAIKCVRPLAQPQDETFITRIIRETLIWKAAAQPNNNILPFIGYQVVDGVPVLVSPWCENGNLATYIAKHPGLTRSRKLKFLCDAARGLTHLHSFKPPIFHGDIKPQNVIVQDNLEGALSDFGISRFVLDGGHCGLTTSEVCSGTSGFLAKEILSGGPPTTAADIYAFGGLILAIMSGNAPFWKKKKDFNRIAAICQDEMPMPVDHPGLPSTDSLWDLLRECWSPPPTSRPSALKLLKFLEAEITASEVASGRADT